MEIIKMIKECDLYHTNNQKFKKDEITVRNKLQYHFLKKISFSMCIIARDVLMKKININKK